MNPAIWGSLMAYGMLRLEGQIQHDFGQIIDDRYNRKPLILAIQLPIKDWYNVFKSELIAEACLDRIVHKSKRFELKGYENNMLM